MNDVGPNGCVCGHNGDCNCPFVPSPPQALAKKKRKKAVPTTARTLEECRRRGWIAGVVERRIPFPKPQGTSIDFFGVIDVIGIVPGEVGSVGIQSTTNTGGHHAKHRTKILAEPRARAWVEAGNRLELWTWAKQGDRGKQKRWTLRVEVFTLTDWPTSASS